MSIPAESVTVSGIKLMRKESWFSAFDRMYREGIIKAFGFTFRLFASMLFLLSFLLSISFGISAVTIWAFHSPILIVTSKLFFGALLVFFGARLTLNAIRRVNANRRVYEVR